MLTMSMSWLLLFSVDVIKTLYPLIIEKTLKSNDTQIIQSGGETVRGFFASAGDQICQMEGGLDAAERVILHLLAPDQPEFSASFAGRLVTLIVLKTQGANIENILSAVLPWDSDIVLIEHIYQSCKVVNYLQFS